MPDVTPELRELRFQIECLAHGLLNQDRTLRRIEEKVDQIIDLATLLLRKEAIAVSGSCLPTTAARMRSQANEPRRLVSTSANIRYVAGHGKHGHFSG